MRRVATDLLRIGIAGTAVVLAWLRGNATGTTLEPLDNKLVNRFKVVINVPLAATFGIVIDSADGSLSDSRHDCTRSAS